MSPYSWTTDDDEIAWDAIIVGIGDDSPALIRAGMTPAEPLTNVPWADGSFLETHYLFFYEYFYVR